MKIRIFLAILAVITVFWSCDEPLPVTDSTYIYNPFAFKQDTLNTVSSITSGELDIEWGDHLAAWVGINTFYKAGFSADFSFPDTLFDSTLVDSVHLEIRHALSFSTGYADTSICLQVYETTGMTPSLNDGVYGDALGCGTVLINGNDNYWSFKLPAELFSPGDSSISLGVFPGADSVLSLLHGNGSSLKPALTFFSHEADTVDSAGNAIITELYHGSADTLYQELIETPDILDRAQYEYLSQFSRDSIIFSLDIGMLVPDGDTLIHISSASFYPSIDTLASHLYIATEGDTVRSFSMSVNDPVSEISIAVEVSDGGTYLSNEIGPIIQAALDDDRTNIDLILRPNHVGYDPGFIAVSKIISETKIQTNAAMAVRP